MVVGRHGGGWQVFVRPKSRQPVVKDQLHLGQTDFKSGFDALRRARDYLVPNLAVFADVIAHDQRALVATLV